ncbi:MAG: ABC transporter ATP-binding protein, partial [Oscillospiraceae bacterium]|nr:ABC transporter ATP-binding protein [Oscillospiraceae bacterium]
MIYSADNITLAYPKMPPVVKSASFDLSEGETMTILGPNGAGKSTLLNCLMGLHTPESGTVELRGKPLAGMSSREIAGTVAYVRQYQTPVFAYTVRDYVMMGRAPKMRVFERPKAVDEEAVDKALVTMGLTELSSRPYTDISGGQRQKA